MTVVKSKREEGDLRVVTNAKILAVYTLKIVTNENNFPKRYRWCLTNSIISLVNEIEDLIHEANSVYVRDRHDYILRKELQNKALSKTYSLLNRIDTAYQIFHIDSKRIKHWVGLVLDVQTPLRNWIKKDVERFKSLG